MNKPLLNFNRFAIVIDTDDWGFGIELSRNLNVINTKSILLDVTFVCLHILIAF